MTDTRQVMSDLVERGTRIARHMVSIATSSQRADGTDIPLGKQCREAADVVLTQAAHITELETALEEARNAALEEAAKVAGELEVSGKTTTMEWANCMAHARDIAQAIRDMKDGPTK